MELTAKATNGTEFFALIVDCGADNSVASDIRDQYDRLIQAGYSTIVGIRDVYPCAHSEIERLRRMSSYAQKTKPFAPAIIFATMEVEAWFLAEHTHYERISSDLSLARIVAELRFDPSGLDIEARPAPASDLDAIYEMVGLRYTKDRKRVQRTLSKLDYAELYQGVPARVPSLGELITVMDAFLAA